jgi:hypothetical protein
MEPLSGTIVVIARHHLPVTRTFAVTISFFVFAFDPALPVAFVAIFFFFWRGVFCLGFTLGELLLLGQKHGALFVRPFEGKAFG